MEKIHKISVPWTFFYCLANKLNQIKLNKKGLFLNMNILINLQKLNMKHKKYDLTSELIPEVGYITIMQTR